MRDDLNVDMVSLEFKNMLKFVDYKKPLPENPTFFQNVEMMLNLMIEFVSDHFFIFVYLIVFVYLLSDSFFSIKNATLRNVLLGVNSGFLLLTLFYLLYIFKIKLILIF
jgi:hypothetical protein